MRDQFVRNNPDFSLESNVALTIVPTIAQRRALASLLCPPADPFNPEPSYRVPLTRTGANVQSVFQLILWIHPN
ncbi:unnamed protein product [Protopolystoma xenopodis]|uniref:Uncharacterized protein n=1 Tax=Protopolystoma xenopodis TaxID=117903 RepID=A0A3S5CRF0_9PLAT|nr:unnamed protein product [Protopolystoma xenopodis]